MINPTASVEDNVCQHLSDIPTILLYRAQLFICKVKFITYLIILNTKSCQDSNNNCIICIGIAD